MNPVPFNPLPLAGDTVHEQLAEHHEAAMDGSVNRQLAGLPKEADFVVTRHVLERMIRQSFVDGATQQRLRPLP